ncbi:MAG TPA: MFS transporter [Burkholderiales bacterium]|jgi:ACS family tartrate transporter-like MFS transporter
MTQIDEKALVRKMAWKVLPFLLAAYLICIIDRLNVGLAALTMNAELGFTATVYGWGAGLFFIGYFIGEVPSNLILSRVGARIWFARIMVTWGIFAIAMGFITGDVSFFVIRFLLGVAEAGFFPGVIYYLTLWFPAEYRGRIFGLFLIISPLNNTIAAPLGGLILKYFDGTMGYPGWRWLFIVEGIPTLFLAWLCLRVVIDRPDNATWLTDAEKAHLRDKLAREAASRTETKHLSIWQTLANTKVLLFAVVYTSLAIGIYGLSLWMPQIIKGMDVQNPVHIGLIMAVPYLIATICMVLWSRHSDKTGERVFHCAGALALAAIGMITSAYIGSPVLAMVAITFAAIGMYCSQPVFWAMPTGYLSGVAAAGGIAFINSIGNLGGFIGPFAVGWLKDNTANGFQAGLTFLAACLLTGAIVAVIVGRSVMRRAAIEAQAA